MPAAETGARKQLDRLFSQAKHSLATIRASLDGDATRELLKEAHLFLKDASARDYLQSMEKLSVRLRRHKQGEELEALVETSIHTAVECCQDEKGAYGYLVGLVLREAPVQGNSLQAFPHKSSWNQFFNEHELVAPGARVAVLPEVVALDQAMALTPPDLLRVREHLQAGRLKRAKNLVNKQAPLALPPASREFSLMMAYVSTTAEDALPKASLRLTALQESLFSYLDASTLESALERLQESPGGAEGTEQPLQLLPRSVQPKAQEVDAYFANQGLCATGFADKWFEALYQAESRVDLIPF